jgi:Fic family protein
MYNKNKPYNSLPFLPPKFNFDTIEILKKLIQANKAVASFDSSLSTLVNPMLLVAPLTIREAVKSSEIENIFTTVSEVFESSLFPESQTPAQKEALFYKDALIEAYDCINTKGGLGINDIIKIQSILEPNKTGVRKIPGTVIGAIRNGKVETLYTPPEGYGIIIDLLSNFEKVFNLQTNHNNWNEIDPLIQFSILHHQFESIHPFYDGNGRTGRILMILFLVISKTIKYPVLFLSGYILENKVEYYQCLNQTTETGDYTKLVIYFLDCIINQSLESKKTVDHIWEHYNYVKQVLQTQKIESNSFEMLDYLFTKPLYTITDMEKNTGKHRNTCSKYLNSLVKVGMVQKRKYKKENIFYNPKFLEILS